MADNSVFDPGTGGDTYRSKDRTGVKTEIVGLDINPAGAEVLGTGDATNGLDVDVTRVQGTVTVTGALTDTQLRATAVPVSGTVTASGPLTDTQLRATAVPVSGPLTDTQLRATAVPVSGTVTASGPLTDTQLRATAVPVSLSTLPALVAGSAAIGKLAANSGVDIGDVDVTSLPALAAGTNLVGFVTVTPSATGGWSKQMYAAQTTTVRTVKGTAGTWGGYGTIYNPNASVAYVQVFDVATATTVTLGTTVPDMIIPIPAGSAANMEIVNGVNMANGIKLACTTTATGSTAPSTGLDLTVFFK